jgi:hypothetical protein
MIRHMREEVGRLLESFRISPSLLSAALRQYPRQMWRYQPRPDRPSIHDMVVELAESEASLYVMSRRWIIQPGPSLTETLNRSRQRPPVYFDQTVLESLKIISCLRRSTYRLLSNLPDHCWNYTSVHPREGSITLNQWLTIQERQISVSIDHMRTNYASWIRLHPAKKVQVKSPDESENAPQSVEVK